MKTKKYPLWIRVVALIILIVLYPYLLYKGLQYKKDTVKIFKAIRTQQRQEVLALEQLNQTYREQVGFIGKDLAAQRRIYREIQDNELTIAFGRNRQTYLIAKIMAKSAYVHRIYKELGVAGGGIGYRDPDPATYRANLDGDGKSIGSVGTHREDAERMEEILQAIQKYHNSPGYLSKYTDTPQ